MSTAMMAITTSSSISVKPRLCPTATSPGCAEQCRGFRDLLPEFHKLDTVILGVSTDSSRSLEKLAQEEHLNFPVYADRKTCQAYDVIRSRGYAQRTTYVIDRKGIVRKVDREPKAQDNPRQVLHYVKEHLAEKK